MDFVFVLLQATLLESLRVLSSYIHRNIGTERHWMLWILGYPYILPFSLIALKPHQIAPLKD